MIYCAENFFMLKFNKNNLAQVKTIFFKEVLIPGILQCLTSYRVYLDRAWIPNTTVLQNLQILF